MATGKRSTARTRGKTSHRHSLRKVTTPLALQLTPTLRDRLFAQMDEAGIPEHGRLAYLCMMTGRAAQTVRRWINKKKPGLPDLLSFAVLCIRFDTDANWFLGLSDMKYKLPRASGGQQSLDPEGGEQQDLAWLDYIARQVAEKGAGYEVFYMPGDEMEPRIQQGAPILVRTSIDEIDGNGIYVLKYKGRTTVRVVENRIGEGLVLSCENKKYKDTVLKDLAHSKRLGLKVIGKAEFWVQLSAG